MSSRVQLPRPVEVAGVGGGQRRRDQRLVHPDPPLGRREAALDDLGVRSSSQCGHGQRQRAVPRRRLVGRAFEPRAAEPVRSRVVPAVVGRLRGGAQHGGGSGVRSERGVRVELAGQVLGPVPQLHQVAVADRVEQRDDHRGGRRRRRRGCGPAATPPAGSPSRGAGRRPPRARAPSAASRRSRRCGRPPTGAGGPPRRRRSPSAASRSRPNARSVSSIRYRVPPSANSASSMDVSTSRDSTVPGSPARPRSVASRSASSSAIPSTKTDRYRNSRRSSSSSSW